MYKETNGITNEINQTNLSSPQPQTNSSSKSKFSKNKPSNQNVKMETMENLVRKLKRFTPLDFIELIHNSGIQSSL